MNRRKRGAEPAHAKSQPTATGALSTAAPAGVASVPPDQQSSTVPLIRAVSRAPWRTWLPGVLLVVSVLLAYQPAWHAGFIWDDDMYVTENKLLTAPDGWSRIWFSRDTPSQYFPLVYSVFRIERGLWGLNPAGYHWVNLLLHAANGLLVWRLLSRLAVPGAWLAAMLFALHPVQVESVAWVTELKNVLSLFFMLLALQAWLSFLRCDGKKRWCLYGAALGCYALALFSKTTACTLPAALVLVWWWRKQALTGRMLALVTPFLALGIGMGAVTVWFERFHVGTRGAEFAVSLPDRFLIAGRGIWFYVSKLLWPFDLTFSYPRWYVTASAPVDYVWLVLLVLLGLVIYRARGWLGRGPEVAAVFYVAMLSPMLGFIMLYTFRYTFVADHYQYAAVIGPLALVAAGLTALLAKLKARWHLIEPACQGALLAGLSALTWHQSRIYRNPETLWRDTVAKNPGSWMAHESLGILLLKKPGGDLDEAAERLEAVIALKPDEGQAHDSLGIIRGRQGRIGEALEQFQQAIRLRPKDPKPYSNLAMVLQNAGRLDEAITQLEAAARCAPDNPEVRNNLGMVLGKAGRLDEAILQLREAIRLAPDSAPAHNNLGLALGRQGRLAEAAAEYEAALRLNPGSAETHTSLAVVLAQENRREEASAHLREALRLRPNYPPAEQQLRALLAH